MGWTKSIVVTYDEGSKNVPSDIPLTVVSISEMKFPELNDSPKARNLVTAVIKAIFIARLELAVENGMAMVENIDPNVIANV